MEELEFQIVAKYIGRLKQEIQDEIVEMIWDLGTGYWGKEVGGPEAMCYF